MAAPAAAGTLLAMLTTHKSSRLLLVASERSVGGSGPVPVRRYRLARVRVNPSAATGAPRLARSERP
jgi:hypothetical protein